MEGHYDLLRSANNTCWAINCQVEEDSVRIGAIYLEPQIPSPNIRLESGSDKIDVLIPEEYLGRSESLRAWNVELPAPHE